MKLATVRTFALALEAVTEAPHFAFSSFRVHGRIFVTVPPGDAVIHVFVGEDDRAPALALHPEWAGTLMWGGKVVGLRLVLATANAAAVKGLVRKAYDTRRLRPVRASKPSRR